MNIISIIIAIILFSIIVIFHELGHFWLAKANGIKVNEFCLGLGPTLFGVQRGETKYSIKLLPFGGACIMEGEDENSGDDRAFNNKSVWARISVVFAGPFFNFIMAFIFALIIICSVMYTEFNTLIVEIKNLSMEVNFMDSSDGLGRSKNNIGADIQVSIVLAGIVDSVRGRIHHRTVFRGTV